MQQQEFWHETIREALRHTVSALGGSKKVAGDLWHKKPIQQAHTLLNNCLDDNRSEKFSLEDLLYLLKRARAEGVHTAMSFILRECGYADPQPVEPEDERAALEREFIQAVDAQRKMLERLERLSGGVNVTRIRQARSEKSI